MTFSFFLAKFCRPNVVFALSLLSSAWLAHVLVPFHEWLWWTEA